MISGIVALVLAAVLLVVGRWGRRNAAGLVPSSLSASARQDKERVVRRGGTTCQIVATWFVLLGIAELVMWAMHQ